MTFKKALLCSLLAAPAVVSAAGPKESFFDVYYAPSAKLDITAPGIPDLHSDGGNGYGLRARALVAPSFFLQGEFQKDSYDGFNGFKIDTDADFFRLGGGVLANDLVYVSAEYIKEKIDVSGSSSSDNGYGFHLGLQGHPGTTSTLYGEAGYTKVGDFGDGFEFSLGGAVMLSETVGLFGDYRHTEQKDDSGGKGTFGDFRVGLRVAFGQ